MDLSEWKAYRTFRRKQMGRFLTYNKKNHNPIKENK